MFCVLAYLDVKIAYLESINFTRAFLLISFSGKSLIKLYVSDRKHLQVLDFYNCFFSGVFSHH